MRQLSRIFLLLALIGLAGCASLQPPIKAGTTGYLTSFHLTGRVSIRYGNEGFSGTLDWQHSPMRDEVLILSPLGQGIAQLVSDDSGVTLTTTDQQEFRSSDAESLTERELGWRFPLSSLPYWVQARPAPGAGAQVRRDGNGLLEQLTQDGWQVDYEGYKTFQSGVLPGRIFMERGDLRLKLAVDQWQP